MDGSGSADVEAIAAAAAARFAAQRGSSPGHRRRGSGSSAGSVG